jgi:hypothetical protein
MRPDPTTRTRGRRVAHLVARFFTSLGARPPDPAAVAWVASVLEPAELRVWEEMGRADRAESVAVARRVEVALAGTDAASDSRWYAAALLHDAGKPLSGYGTIGRAAVTVAAAALGDARLRAWAGDPATRRSSSSVRARMGRYVAHDELGALRLREAGVRPEVAAWADAHHRPGRWAATGIPSSICRALAAADGEPAGPGLP